MEVRKKQSVVTLRTGLVTKMMIISSKGRGSISAWEILNLEFPKDSGILLYKWKEMLVLEAESVDHCVLVLVSTLGMDEVTQ